MSSEQIAQALIILNEYPAVANYIKTFNGSYGFLYTVETDLERIDLQEKMNRVLDDGSHSGASFALMMRNIQAILCER